VRRPSGLGFWLWVPTLVLGVLADPKALAEIPLAWLIAVPTVFALAGLALAAGLAVRMATRLTTPARMLGAASAATLLTLVLAAGRALGLVVTMIGWLTAPARMLTLASMLLPRPARARYLEQWLAETLELKAESCRYPTRWLHAVRVAMSAPSTGLIVRQGMVSRYSLAAGGHAPVGVHAPTRRACQLLDAARRRPGSLDPPRSEDRPG
jgi:hypothetical protein